MDTAITDMPHTPELTPRGGTSLHLWQLISPALPIGAYSYSGGLEYAVEAGWADSRDGVSAWVGTQLREVLSRLDVPVLARLHAACTADDAEAIDYWNGVLRASRESAELEAEDLHLGSALIRLLIDLDVDRARPYAERRTGFATAFALAATHWGIGLGEAAEGYLWAWCENQVAAAVKLVPLGQTDGQRLMLGFIDDIRAAVALGLSLDEESIGASAPGVAMASALHESQYTRLFRS